jgi:transposase
MTHSISATMGLDVGDRKSHFCVLDETTGEILREGTVATRREDLRVFLSGFPTMRVVQETGGHSPWISAVVEECGHESVVAQASRVALIYGSHNKCDRVDAEMLARLGRVDRRLLSPVRHRSEAAQRHRSQLKARQLLVRTRAALVLHCRGTVKSFGERLPACSTKAFHRLAAAHIPEHLHANLAPILAVLELTTDQITRMDGEIKRLCAEVYTETQRLAQVPGVGPLTALCYVLTIEDPKRFARSRDVGAYVGLVPRRDQSGKIDKQLRITKAGDRMLRTLLVQCAHYIVGPFGPDTALRRWALPRLEGGGAAMKKRTVIAVARKLAVLLHRLWLSGAEYDALRGQPALAAA